MSLVGRSGKSSKLIIQGFGLQALRTKAYQFGEESTERQSDGTSYLGTPVFSNIEFIEGTYTNLQGDQIDYLKSGDNFGLRVDTVLMTVSQSKIIQRTRIQGRNGTVKEYISDGDYDITIRGLLVDESSSRYPEEQVNKLIEVCKVQKEIPISSRYLNDVFGVTNIVIDSYSLPQLEGVENTQPFEIKCFSDDPIELVIRNT